MLITTDNDFHVENDGLRKNTVRCDFSFLRRDLSVLELHGFVEHYLQLAPEHVTYLQWNGVERCLYLRLCDLCTARRLVAVHSRRHTFPEGRHGARVTMKLIDVPMEVLMFDLSELVTDEQVHATMAQYGVVIAIGHSHWGPGVRYAGTPSGQRLVRMVMRKTVPKYVRIGNEVSSVYYPGQQYMEPRAGYRLLHNVVLGWNFMGRMVRTISPTNTYKRLDEE
ncbi:uncharacterized protein LOC125774432 [Anopheles funestus]|uniref:uncharacterized protein LOC125774432 n=1 Tax=Anopheles funestus TaxID=62324 RepID=UPI0020C6E1EB|nr:uncharacterized protein LOC125774432 [Anopheles funestus]